jgi:hypothetical protein
MSKLPINFDEFSQEEQALWHQLGDIDAPSPSPKLKADFHAMLQAFDTGTGKKVSFWQKWYTILFSKSGLRVAYTMALMLSTGLIGYFFSNKTLPSFADQSKVQQLSNEVHEMKEMMMLAMLQNPQATERMKAVSYTKELNEIDGKILAALIATFKDDENDNVRMVALNALIKLADEPQVRETLIESLMQERSPLIQVALADAMLKLQEKKSVNQLKQRLKETQLNKFVKEKFVKTIEKLST